MCEHLLTSIMRHAKEVKNQRSLENRRVCRRVGISILQNSVALIKHLKCKSIQEHTRASLLKSSLRPVLLQFTLHLKRQKSAWSTKVTLMADSETRQGGQGGSKWMTLMEREQNSSEASSGFKQHNFILSSGGSKIP